MGLFSRQEPRVCWVRSETDDPCGRPAATKISGVPFCERCAREHEEYAAIGTLTDPASGGEPGRLRDASLAESLRRLRRERVSRTALRGALSRNQKV
jgi:hypothetical protein